jgi:hypothetical protein
MFDEESMEYAAEQGLDLYNENSIEMDEESII